MKQAALISIIVIGVVILLVISGTFYVVDETKQVIITQFGKPIGEPRTEPGLKMKMPFLQKARYFEKRFLEWDGDRNQLPTKDKRFIFVDTYARWHITDPLRFLERLRDERGAQSRLDDILDGETRNTIAKHNLIEVVRTSNREFAVAEDMQEERLEEEFEDIEFGAIRMNIVKFTLGMLFMELAITFHRHTAVRTLFNNCQPIKVSSAIPGGMGF